MVTHAVDHVGLEILSDHECYQLLATAHLGRIGVTLSALPAILPIHFALLDRDPVFRTDEGAKLMAASNGQVLCLEVDHFDPESHAGWSVSVTGTAHVITAPTELAVARSLPLRPWVGHGDAFVRIDASIVSGRRIPRPHPSGHEDHTLG